MNAHHKFGDKHRCLLCLPIETTGARQRGLRLIKGGGALVIDELLYVVISLLQGFNGGLLAKFEIILCGFE